MNRFFFVRSHWDSQIKVELVERAQFKIHCLRNEPFVPPHSWYRTTDQVELIWVLSLRYELVSQENHKSEDIGTAKVVQIRPKV